MIEKESSIPSPPQAQLNMAAEETDFFLKGQTIPISVITPLFEIWMDFSEKKNIIENLISPPIDEAKDDKNEKPCIICFLYFFLIILFYGKIQRKGRIRF